MELGSRADTAFAGDDSFSDGFDASAIAGAGEAALAAVRGAPAVAGAESTTVWGADSVDFRSNEGDETATVVRLISAASEAEMAGMADAVLVSRETTREAGEGVSGLMG